MHNDRTLADFGVLRNICERRNNGGKRNAKFDEVIKPEHSCFSVGYLAKGDQEVTILLA